MRCASVPQIDVDRTRARTSFAPGSGMGFSAISRTLGSRTTRACIVWVMGVSRVFAVVLRAGPAAERGAGGPVHRLSKLGARRSARQVLSIIDEEPAPAGARAGGRGASGGPICSLGRLPGREVTEQELADRQLVPAGGLGRAVGVMGAQRLEDGAVLEHDLADVDVRQGQRDEGPGE